MVIIILRLAKRQTIVLINAELTTAHYYRPYATVHNCTILVLSKFYVNTALLEVLMSVLVGEREILSTR